MEMKKKKRPRVTTRNGYAPTRIDRTDVERTGTLATNPVPNFWVSVWSVARSFWTIQATFNSVKAGFLSTRLLRAFSTSDASCSVCVIMLLASDWENAELACDTRTESKAGRKERCKSKQATSTLSAGIVDKQQRLTVISVVVVWTLFARLVACSWMACHGRSA